MVAKPGGAEEVLCCENHVRRERSVVHLNLPKHVEKLADVTRMMDRSLVDDVHLGCQPKSISSLDTTDVCVCA